MEFTLKEAQFMYQREGVPVRYLAIRSDKGAPESVLELQFHRIYPALEKLSVETGKNFRLMNPRLMDRLVYESPMGCDMHYATDGIIAYGKPGEKLGAELVFYERGTPRLILPTGKYQGEKDIAMVVMGLSSADFVEEGRDIHLPIAEDRFTIVEGFPAENGRYRKHKLVPVPYGEPYDPNGLHSLYLYRVRGHYVGGLVRAGSVYGDCFRADFMPWDKFVAVATEAGDTAELIATCSAPLKLRMLIEKARVELRDVSDMLRPEKTAALRKLVMLALEAKEE